MEQCRRVADSLAPLLPCSLFPCSLGGEVVMEELKSELNDLEQRIEQIKERL